MRDFFSSNSAPKGFSGGAIQAKHDIFVCSVRMRDAEDTLRLVFRLGKGWIDFSGIDGCKQENLIAPNDWRCAAVPGDGYLPLNVFIFAPCDRWLRGRGSACGIGSAPLMPVFRFGFLEIRCGRVENESRPSYVKEKSFFHVKESVRRCYWQIFRY